MCHGHRSYSEVQLRPHKLCNARFDSQTVFDSFFLYFIASSKCSILFSLEFQRNTEIVFCTFSLAPALFSHVCYLPLSWLLFIMFFFSVVFYIPPREAVENLQVLFTSVDACWHDYDYSFTTSLSWVTCSRKVVFRKKVFQWLSSFSSWCRRWKCINSREKRESMWTMGRFPTPKWRYPDKGSKYLAKSNCARVVPWLNDIWGLRVNPAHEKPQFSKTCSLLCGAGSVLAAALSWYDIKATNCCRYCPFSEVKPFLQSPPHVRSLFTHLLQASWKRAEDEIWAEIKGSSWLSNGRQGTSK